MNGDGGGTDLLPALSLASWVLSLLSLLNSAACRWGHAVLRLEEDDWTLARTVLGPLWVHGA